MARKPFPGTVAANVLQHGTGAINVDACRIPSDGSHMVRGTVTKRTTVSGDERTGKALGMYGAGASFTPTNHEGGRWPANVLLDEAAAEALDAMSGERKSGAWNGKRNTPKTKGVYGEYESYQEQGKQASTGGASRFFKTLPIDEPGTSRMAYHPKASRRERNAGLDGMPEREQPNTWGDLGAVEGNPRKPNTGHVQRVQNHHPTVKPIALMRYLITLVTPPGGTVLDPFAGSGSTLVAAAELGFPAIGIEMSEEYAEIAARRVDHALNQRAGRLPLEVAV